MEICPKSICTGCSACKEICPKQCISMQPDELASLHPVVDMSQCVDCGLCRKVCPNNHSLPTNKVLKVYAAWSNDEAQRLSSASGGIAYELYRYILRQNGVGAGVVLDEEGCRFILVENEDDIMRTKNSKYVFSDTNGIYRKVRDRLSQGQKVLFIGLPCQVAGLCSYLKGKTEGLYMVDIICHGVPPYDYFDQHIKHIESNTSQKTKVISFRDPRYYTYTYTFTLSNRYGTEFYARKVADMDAYQIGYHRALIYRDNCYKCRYAQRERVGDLTIGDFSGLGTLTPSDYPNRNVSCVLCNTTNGERLIEQMGDFITFEQRPMEEAFNYERQLKAPSIPHPKREKFKRIYIEKHSFKEATDICLRMDRLANIYVKIKAFCYKNIIRLPYRGMKYIICKLCKKGSIL